MKLVNLSVKSAIFAVAMIITGIAAADGTVGNTPVPPGPPPAPASAPLNTNNNLAQPTSDDSQQQLVTSANATDVKIMSNALINIAQDPSISGLGIKVASQNGVVIVSGMVDTQAQLDNLVKATASVSGVSDLKLLITIRNAGNLFSSRPTPSAARTY